MVRPNCRHVISHGEEQLAFFPLEFMVTSKEKFTSNLYIVDSTPPPLYALQMTKEEVLQLFSQAPQKMLIELGRVVMRHKSPGEQINPQPCITKNLSGRMVLQSGFSLLSKVTGIIPVSVTDAEQLSLAQSARATGRQMRELFWGGYSKS